MREIAHAQKRNPLSDLDEILLFVRFLGFFISSTAKTPARILTQNTSKNAVPRKDVCLFGLQNQKLSFKPLFAQKTAILGPVFEGTRKFLLENALTLEIYQVNDP